MKSVCFQVFLEAGGKNKFLKQNSSTLYKHAFIDWQGVRHPQACICALKNYALTMFGPRHAVKQHKTYMHGNYRKLALHFELHDDLLSALHPPGFVLAPRQSTLEDITKGGVLEEVLSEVGRASEPLYSLSGGPIVLAIA